MVYIGMNRYEKGQIYKIVDIGQTKMYIGSTTEPWSKRMERHRSDYKQYLMNEKHYMSSFSLFDEFGIDNCKILWMENYPCSSKKELLCFEWSPPWHLKHIWHYFWHSKMLWQTGVTYFSKLCNIRKMKTIHRHTWEIASAIWHLQNTITTSHKVSDILCDHSMFVMMEITRCLWWDDAVWFCDDALWWCFVVLSLISYLALFLAFHLAFFRTFYLSIYQTSLLS